ncbi:MAG: hypothetical protein K8L91_05980 [Anaerolineae bacterium]|nr:hypothetical protein [Anaerolineae bacterium]
MSQIPTSVTEEQFENHIRPYLSVAKRGYVSKIALYKIFNYILYRLHTGCQWEQLPIAADREDAQKKKSVGRRCITIFASGVRMEVLSGCGSRVWSSFARRWICGI